MSFYLTEFDVDTMPPPEEEVPEEQESSSGGEEENSKKRQLPIPRQKDSKPEDKTSKAGNKEAGGKQGAAQPGGNNPPMNSQKVPQMQNLQQLQQLRQIQQTGINQQAAEEMAKNLAKEGGKKLLKEGGKKAVLNPYVLGFILILIIILLLFFMIFSGSNKKNEETQGTLTFNKTGPDYVPNPNGGNVPDMKYTLSASYDQPAEDIVITDTIPAGTTFATASGKFTTDKQGNKVVAVKWSLKENSIATGGTSTAAGNNTQPGNTLEIILRPDPGTKDKYVTNKATAEVVNAGNKGGVSPAACGNKPNTNTTDFVTLMTGQGKCTTVLGDENSFVNTVIKNAGSKFGLTGKESYIHQIYKAAIAKNINPLISITIWGVEAGWNVNGTEFGCKPFGSGFNSQLTCDINTLNNLMNEYDQKAKKGTPVSLDTNSNCKYTDAFIYAYERYTPVCGMNDSNGVARKNFVNYYKTLLGV